LVGGEASLAGLAFAASTNRLAAVDIAAIYYPSVIAIAEWAFHGRKSMVQTNAILAIFVGPGLHARALGLLGDKPRGLRSVAFQFQYGPDAVVRAAMVLDFLSLPQETDDGAFALPVLAGVIRLLALVTLLGATRWLLRL